MAKSTLPLIACCALVMATDVKPGTRAAEMPSGAAPHDAAPVFRPSERAVSTWRLEAADHLILTADQIMAFRGDGIAPRVARCVKLNNYWCIKKAGWNGEMAVDDEGHVAFASAVEGAAVAALLLKRYYVDFDRHSALAIISRWAPAQCGLGGSLISGGGGPAARALAPRGLGNTLRARWLAGHLRGFVVSAGSRRPKIRRSVVVDHRTRMLPAPTIAAGLGDLKRPSRPMTLDALLMSSPNAPPSRSMLGMTRGARIKGRSGTLGTVSGCGFDGPRIAAYAAQAAAGMTPGPGGDLLLFAMDGTPTANLKIMMANMARVEIGPYAATPALIDAGIAEAFKPGRNPDKS